jgi:hypothetical protein
MLLHRTERLQDALLLRPLPVARPGDVISVGTKVSLAEFSSLVNSYPDFRDLRCVPDPSRNVSPCHKFMIW